MTHAPGLDGLASTPEFETVREILEGAALPTSEAERPGDDAVLLPSAAGMVASIDTAVEGTHFRLGWITPAEAGGRAVRAALSDLAAVGARPVAVMLALSGPDPKVLAEAGRAAREAAEAESARLVGGDLARAEGPITITVTVLGDLQGRPMLTRSGAAAGTPLWVTGSLGGAAAAVHAWGESRAPGPDARECFLRPTPRWREALWLREQLEVRALIDLSDGLAVDALNLGRASGAGVRIRATEVPVAEAALRQGKGEAAALRLALTGGEDYELLLAAAVPADLPERFRDRFGVRLTRVGELVQPTRAVSGGADAPDREEASEAALGTLVHPDGRQEPLEGGFGHWDDEWDDGAP